MFGRPGIIVLVAVFACVVSVRTTAAWEPPALLQQERLIVVKEEGKPPQKCRVVKCWTEKDGTRVCMVQAVDSGEMMTILEEIVQEKNGIWGVKSRITHKGAGKTATVPGARPPRPSTLPPAAPHSNRSDTLLGRLFGTSSAASAPVVHAEVESARGGTDLRESWGKLKHGSSTPAPRDDAASRVLLPLARRQQHDPLTQPDELRKATGSTERPIRRLFQSDRQPAAPTAQSSTPRQGLTLASLFGNSTTSKESAGCTTCQSKEKVTSPKTSTSERPGLLSRLFNDKSNTKPAKSSTTVAKTTQPKQATAADKTGKSPPAESRTLLQVVGLSPRSPKPAVTPVTPPRGMMAYPSLPVAGGNAFTQERSIAQPGIQPNLSLAMAMMMAGMHPSMMGGMYPAMGGYPAPQMPMAGYYYPPPQAYYYPPPAPYRPSPQAMATAAARPGRATVTDQSDSREALRAQLRDSLLPSEREMAAEQLARANWKNDPETVQALIQAAQYDPAPVVRATCVRALGKMKANTLPVVQAVQTLKRDGDIRVRQEVEQTLAILTKP